MNTRPYAYAVWFCGVCNLQARDDGSTVICEVCGREYTIENSSIATYIKGSKIDA